MHANRQSRERWEARRQRLSAEQRALQSRLLLDRSSRARSRSTKHWKAIETDVMNDFSTDFLVRRCCLIVTTFSAALKGSSDATSADWSAFARALGDEAPEGDRR